MTPRFSLLLFLSSQLSPPSATGAACLSAYTPFVPFAHTAIVILFQTCFDSKIALIHRARHQTKPHSIGPTEDSTYYILSFYITATLEHPPSLKLL